jgi:GrpB-like predicted nucleotidyltransferase (UPF0157 family)
MISKVNVVPYDTAWPVLYDDEHAAIIDATGILFVALEHIGSTAVPGLAAKPIIDMMAAVHSLDDGVTAMDLLAALGYRYVETEMPRRFLLRRHASQRGCTFHLHIVEHATWNERKERLLRDYLRAHPDMARAYGDLKQQLATHHAHDLPAYTRAKTAFIQFVIDQARHALGLARIDVWE